MSAEENARFAADVQEYLKTNTLILDSLVRTRTGFVYLDLNEEGAKRVDGSLRLVRVKKVPLEDKSDKAAFLPAYWVRWEPGTDPISDVHPAAVYLFTTALDGCRLTVEETAWYTKVAHICGTTWDTGPARQDRQDQKFLPMARKYSATDLNAAEPKSVPSSGVGGVRNGYYTILVGVRKATWKFYAQNVYVTPSGGTTQNLRLVGTVDEVMGSGTPSVSSAAAAAAAAAR